MASIVQHIIKKCYSGIKFDSQSQQRNLLSLQKYYRINKDHDSDGELGHFCDMKYLESTQDFYEYNLPDVSPPDTGKKFSGYEGNESVAEGGYKSNNNSYHTVHVYIP